MPGYQLRVTNVFVPRDVCHVITQELDVTLISE